MNEKTICQESDINQDFRHAVLAIKKQTRKLYDILKAINPIQQQVTSKQAVDIAMAAADWTKVVGRVFEIAGPSDSEDMKAAADALILEYNYWSEFFRKALKEDVQYAKTDNAIYAVGQYGIFVDYFINALKNKTKTPEQIHADVIDHVHVILSPVQNRQPEAVSEYLA